MQVAINQEKNVIFKLEHRLELNLINIKEPKGMWFFYSNSKMLNLNFRLTRHPNSHLRKVSFEKVEAG